MSGVLNVRDTVAVETPACLATSLILGMHYFNIVSCRCQVIVAKKLHNFFITCRKLQVTRSVHKLLWISAVLYEFEPFFGKSDMFRRNTRQKDCQTSPL